MICASGREVRFPGNLGELPLVRPEDQRFLDRAGSGLRSLGLHTDDRRQQAQRAAQLFAARYPGRV